MSNIENNVGFLKKVGENQEQSEFWKQPDGLGYRPCLGFSREYNKWSGEHAKDRTRYLMVVVTGGMNQQRNQIVDAVVIARILGAALVVPNLQVNVIWGDERFVPLIYFLFWSKIYCSEIYYWLLVSRTPIWFRFPPVKICFKFVRNYCFTGQS